MLAKGLSAPQHSTYLVILLDGRDLLGTPGVAVKDYHTFDTPDKIIVPYSIMRIMASSRSKAQNKTIDRLSKNVGI